ncbi:MAG: prolipoprotein diacylglyceryl transferase [Coxiellaceae bacterium]|jgi:phosphatidylglycerol:prolipoprotein diacylglycerol transferase|nr:prolipoprotein diacylglyceryl transferase [Coxiellaceae bacterium]
MFNHPQIDPIAIHLGPVKIYWYGITYLVGFALAWILARLRAKKYYPSWNSDIISNLIFYCVVGGIIGGRLGYVLIYNVDLFFHDPLFIFQIWLGGMSFHGGIIGVITSLFFFTHKIKIPFLAILDFVAPLAPLGIALGRIGNFINSELWGRITIVPWGIIFPNGGPLPRHPSQLYESFAEGILLFIIIWFYTTKPKSQGMAAGLFLFGYGISRFICEFFREPDVQIGFVALNWLTMGQLLSLPVIIVGMCMFLYGKKTTNHSLF